LTHEANAYQKKLKAKNAENKRLDRAIDELMERTSKEEMLSIMKTPLVEAMDEVSSMRKHIGRLRLRLEGLGHFHQE